MQSSIGSFVRPRASRRPIACLRFPLAEGDLVPGATLGRVARAGREITVPIAPEHALGGALEPGDRVDVLGSFDKGTESAKTLTVAAGAQVVDVVHADGLFGQREGRARRAHDLGRAARRRVRRVRDPQR